MAQINLITQALLDAAVALRAPLASPAFTGTITLNGVNVSADAQVVDVTKTVASTRADTTFATESTLQLPVAANEKWDVYACYVLRGDAANDAKVDIQGPAGATIVGQLRGQYQGDAAENEALTALGESHTINTKGTAADTDKTVAILEFRVTVAATAGTITFRLAKNANTVTTTDLTIDAGSFLRAQRVA